VGVTET